ncbi:MAG: glycine cleavage system protein GcvH [Myxococcales bacterium]|nr:glycine cleavage system protein GcvH [Myxococcales bacterium]
MPNFPDDLKYTEDHEWAKADGELVRIGITAYAVEQLGDVTLVDLPEPGTTLENHGHFGDIESVKAVSELFAPIAGEVVEVNGALEESPELVNDDPYGEGWMLTIRPSDPSQLEALMTAQAYRELVESQ